MGQKQSRMPKSRLVLSFEELVENMQHDKSFLDDIKFKYPGRYHKYIIRPILAKIMPMELAKICVEFLGLANITSDNHELFLMGNTYYKTMYDSWSEIDE